MAGHHAARRVQEKFVQETPSFQLVVLTPVEHRQLLEILNCQLVQIREAEFVCVEDERAITKLLEKLKA